MNELELIRLFFANQPVSRDDVVLGIGDDAALVTVPPGTELAITTDTLVAGVDFLPEADPVGIGHKALAVNLSDLAAMGAAPAWFTLTLTLPKVDPSWVQGFAQGLFGLARRFRVVLVGGDLSHGPLAVSISAYGHAPHGAALRRDGASVGDLIYVTGTLGDAALALMHELGERSLPKDDLPQLSERLHRPMPRLEEGVRLRGIASAMIDLSDGLLTDLAHMGEVSGVGAKIRLGDLPLSETYRRHLPEVGYDPAIATGDDYELCFTVPPARTGALEQLKRSFAAGFACIGEVVEGTGVTVVDQRGAPYVPARRGYDHFAE